MTIEKWEEVLAKLEVLDELGTLGCVEEDFDQYEQETGFKLPESYRTYLQVFGVGDLIRPGSFRVLSPGEENKNIDLGTFNFRMKDKSGLGLGKKPPFDRAVFFATDIGTDAYYWDPQEVTDAEHHEYKIYVLGRSYEVMYLADSFWNLVTEVIMKTGLPLDDYTGPIRQVFRPLE